MYQLLNGIVWLFTRGPLGSFLIAAALIGFGYQQYMAAESTNEARAAALAEGPPPVVDIDTYIPARNDGHLGEVNVRAQLDLTWDYQLTLTTNSGNHYAYMVPLVEVKPDAARPAVLGYLLWNDSDFTFDQFDPMTFLINAEGFGTVGPILTLNGLRDTPGQFDDMIADAFAENGRVLPPEPLILSLFDGDRAAYFAPRDPRTPLVWLGGLGALFVAVGLGRLVVRRPTPAGPGPADPVEETPAQRTADRPGTDLPLPSYIVSADPPAAAGRVPEWKVRLDAKLEAKAKGRPLPPPIDPTLDVRAMMGLRKPQKPAAAVRTPAEQLRRAALGFVGAIFALVLVAGFYGVWTSIPEPEPEPITLAELAAQGLAQALVPTTPPAEKEWYEIDLAPVAQWFIEKATLAMAGDQAAILTLSMMLIGFISLLIGLKIVVMARMMAPRVRPGMESYR